MIDYTKLRAALDPDPGGEDTLRLRTAVVQTMNADGTVDILLSGVVVPGVPRLDNGGWLAAGANVQVITLRGGHLILGASQKGARRVEAFNGNNPTWQNKNYTALSGGDILGVAFIAPPSGTVKLTLMGWLSMNSATLQRRSFISAWVANGSVINSGSVVSSPDDERAAVSQNSVASIHDYKYVNVQYTVGGLTPGNAYNVTMAHRGTSDSTGSPDPVGTSAANERRIIVEPW